jgi:predicted dehydrogenase
MRPLRVAVVGLGRIGALHAEHAFGQVPFAELVAVADVDEALARSTGERFGAVWTTDTAQLLADPTIDAVVLATPTAQHPDHVEAAALAGKAIFCEKPLALSDERTRQVIAAVETAGVPLQVGLHRRLDPDTAEAKRAVEAGELGTPYSFRTSLRDMNPQPLEYIANSGSFFIDVSIHDLDLARWLVGEIVEVTAFGSSVSDPGYAEMDSVDHAVIVGVIDNSRVAGYGYEASTELVGSKSTLRIANSQRTQVTVLSDANARNDHAVDFVERFRDAYRLELVAFVEAVRNGVPPPVTGWDALAAFTLATASDRSWRTGRPVALTVDRSNGRIEYRIDDGVPAAR